MDLKQLRERAGLKAIDVAYQLGVAESTVRNWEKGRSIPRLAPEQFRTMFNIYKCSFEEWIEAYETTVDKYDKSKDDDDG